MIVKCYARFTTGIRIYGVYSYVATITRSTVLTSRAEPVRPLYRPVNIAYSGYKLGSTLVQGTMNAVRFRHWGTMLWPYCNGLW